MSRNRQVTSVFIDAASCCLWSVDSERILGEEFFDDVGCHLAGHSMEAKGSKATKTTNTKRAHAVLMSYISA